MGYFYKVKPDEDFPVEGVNEVPVGRKYGVIDSETVEK
jgi:hypothetical protein